MSTYSGEPGEDLWIAPAPGLDKGLHIHEGELPEHFSRSSGPGGQGVDTTSAKVELRYDIGATKAMTSEQRIQALEYLSPVLAQGELIIQAREHRSQWQNRLAARERLVEHLLEALSPLPPERRATTRTETSNEERIATKKEHGRTKVQRARVDEEEES